MIQKKAITAEVSNRYIKATKKDKVKILDELCKALHNSSIIKISALMYEPIALSRVPSNPDVFFN